MSNVKGAAVKPSQSLNLGIFWQLFSYHIFSKLACFKIAFIDRICMCIFFVTDVNQQKKFIRFYKDLGEVSEKSRQSFIYVDF